MHYATKQSLYQSFLFRWGKEFQNVRSIVAYLNDNPELAERLSEPILSAESLGESQLEWISLVAQLEHPLDTSFFKDYWVPITKDGYGDFIDLSSPDFAIFTLHYFPFEPYRWYTDTIIQDTSRFLFFSNERSVDSDKDLFLNRSARWNHFFRLWDERKQLGLKGKVEPTPVDSYWLFDEYLYSSYSVDNDRLIINGVSALAIGLIPYETKIRIDHFKPLDRDEWATLDLMKDIKRIMFLIQSKGSINVDSFHIQMVADKACYACYEHDVFTLYDPDRFLIEKVVEKLKTIRANSAPF